MKSIAPTDRPREKLLQLGPGALGDNELLAIILGNGVRHAGALEVANALLAAAGGLHGLLKLGRDDLCRVAGIGMAKAAQVVAALEFGRRTLTRAPAARPQLLTPNDTAAFLLPRYGARPVEQFGIVLLDTKHRVLRTTVLSIGTLDSSVVHPREVFREAASALAACIVLFHNHPSGDPLPSSDDVALTRRLEAAGRLMGIDVIDHVILADTRYYSFREAGRL